MIKIEKMTCEHFDKFRAISIKSYAEALSVSKEMSIEKAAIISENEFNSLLPKGIDSDNMFFGNLLFDKKVIGYLWYGIIGITAYIYDFIIDESYRNKGYGKEIFLKLQSTLKNHHVEFIELNVFSHNTKAIDFYNRLNFKAQCLVMTKKVT